MTGKNDMITNISLEKEWVCKTCKHFKRTDEVWGICCYKNIKYPSFKLMNETEMRVKVNHYCESYNL